MVAFAALPVALRIALLPHHPVPTPDVYDEFGHLLVADTLRHFRLANPPHALYRFFETFFVLQQPTYSSIYPIGQGLVLAIGWSLFGLPWAGVLLSTASFCALCYWMLRGWTTPGWALVGGLLAVFEFGPLNQWTNGYWGGALTAAAGCLVFGALPRLRRSYSTRVAVLLGLGLASHLLTRPYESIFLIMSVILYWITDWRRALKPALVAAFVTIPAVGLILLQNKSVTHSWLTLPYTLSQYQYGVPASLTFQPSVTPHRQLTREQELDYRMQRAFRASEVETPGTYTARLLYRARYYRFYFYSPLYLALFVFILTLRNYETAWIPITVVLFSLGVNFFPAFQTHYQAAIASLFILMSVLGLERLGKWKRGDAAARSIVYLCAAQFIFFYGSHVLEDHGFAAAIRRFETWDNINHSNSGRRIEMYRRISAINGNLVIFVRYWPDHVFQEEWVYNKADIDRQRVIMARDLGEPENAALRNYYPDRAYWLLEPDASPPRLTVYKPEPSQPPPQPQKEITPGLRLEQVR